MSVNIYNLCYSLSQACNTLQIIENTLYPRSCNINQEGIETQHIIGLSSARWTLTTIAKSLSENSYCKLFKHFIQDAIEHIKWLLVLIIDDFTSIHVPKEDHREIRHLKQSQCAQ